MSASRQIFSLEPRITLVYFCLIFFTANAHATWYRYSSEAMTTPITLELWSESELQAERLSRSVFSEFDRIEAVMSRYRDSSEISRLNRNASSSAQTISPELFYVIEQAQRISRLSHGAFDITFASTGYLYDFRQKRQPTMQELARQNQVSFQDIRLDHGGHQVRFAKADIILDLGGIAKGYAVDRGIDILKKAGIQHAQLSAGGDLRLLGDKRGKPWIVGIKDPRLADEHAVVLPLNNAAISTSGDYERFFISESGERIHHILSPVTGRPVQGIQSVTIIGKDAITTDGLSTAVFVLGVEKGLMMINELAGIDAIIIDAKRKLHYSEGLMSPE